MLREKLPETQKWPQTDPESSSNNNSICFQKTGKIFLITCETRNILVVDYQIMSEHGTGRQGNTELTLKMPCFLSSYLYAIGQITLFI